MTGERSPSVDRRTVLGGIATGAASALAGCSLLAADDDSTTRAVDEDRARELAEQFAPTLYFDEHEQWFPTDPRPYETERDGESVVDGFDALNGYVERGGDGPVDPVSFYHVVAYEDSPLAVVQFWFYSAFDQFTTNFHWHDWEVLHVFVDTDTEEPQLYVASSHSRRVPNNEHLDPDGSRRPRILTELGSHSSGLSVNDVAEEFQRLSLDGDVADITNSVIDSVESIAAIPLAYGLPRDEGLALPYVVPELDGEPFYEHDRLPAVDASHLIDEDLTVRSFDSVESPPELPQRETGFQFDYRGADDADPDVGYALEPASDLEHIQAFAGPQLSFEFAVPEFVENAVAGHITTTGVPWQTPRYENPAEDISEPRHRQALADRYDAIGEPSAIHQVVAQVSNAVADADAPDGQGLRTEQSPLELFALFQSDPEAVPTFNGVAVLQGVEPGEHTLTVNGAGVEPHSETVSVAEGDDVTTAGVDGEIPVVAREKSVKLEVDPSEADSELTDLAVEDDFAGRLYDAPLSGPDAVYVHEGGAFTTEVRDSDDEVGAFRVNPTASGDDEGDEGERGVRVENPRTGKAPLASYLADVAAETRDQVAAVEGDADDSDDDQNGGGPGNAVNGLVNALDAVVEHAERAAERAEAGDRGNTDKQLEAVANRLERVATRLSEAEESLPPGLARAADKRLDQSRRRSEQAQKADKL